MTDEISRNSIALILGGGRGTRLFPLTLHRCKPAVSVAGQYRLIDIPISNCINSGIQKIFVLTQFLSASLHWHITGTFRFDTFNNRFVEILASEQTPTNYEYAQGTADAVRQTIRYIEAMDEKYVFILSGDQLYRMDFSGMLRHHIETGADVSLSTLPVGKADARRYGILKIDAGDHIVDFVEKPENDALLESLRSRDRGDKPFLASMGLYVFNRKVLLRILQESDETDFGKGIFPKIIHTHSVSAYVFEGFWEDIGTIRSYFDTSISLTSRTPPFTFFDYSMPIYTRHRHLPPPKLFSSQVDMAIVANGSIVQNSQVRRSIVGVRSFIEGPCSIAESIISGNDSYPSSYEDMSLLEKRNLEFGIRENCMIHKAIIDKNAVIGKGSRIIGCDDDSINTKHSSSADFHIVNGIVVVPKGSRIPENTAIVAEDYK